MFKSIALFDSWLSYPNFFLAATLCYFVDARQLVFVLHLHLQFALAAADSADGVLRPPVVPLRCPMLTERLKQRNKSRNRQVPIKYGKIAMTLIWISKTCLLGVKNFKFQFSLTYIQKNPLFLISHHFKWTNQPKYCLSTNTALSMSVHGKLLNSKLILEAELIPNHLQTIKWINCRESFKKKKKRTLKPQ